MILQQDDIDIKLVASYLQRGKIVVLRTDTLYGIIAAAGNQSAVEKVYKLKSRTETKSPIVLISDNNQMFDPFPVSARHLIDTSWPEKTSIIIPSIHAPEWIERGNKSVAYRLPNVRWLKDLLNITGPLIAPSANPEGELPANSITEAIKYFGDAVIVYVDGGVVKNTAASTILKVEQNGEIRQLR